MKRTWLVILFALVIALAACSAQPTPIAPVVITLARPTVVVPTPPPPTNVPPPTVAPTKPPAPTLPLAQRITFQTGQFNTSVQGKLAADGMDRWILRIIGGQTLSANLVLAGGKAKLTIVGADGNPLVTDHADALQWSGKVPATQDYTVAVIAFDHTAPSYTLQITAPPLAQPTIPPAPAAKRISFAPGGISATVQGVTPAVSVDRWVVAAMGGQTLSVNLVVPPGGRAALVIYGVDGTVLISDHASALQWSGPLPKTQDYFIDVKPETGAVSYSLTVTIPPR